MRNVLWFMHRETRVEEGEDQHRFRVRSKTFTMESFHRKKQLAEHTAVENHKTQIARTDEQGSSAKFGVIDRNAKRLRRISILNPHPAILITNTTT